ncbi:MAG TPA: metalloregulator ArsR/SmtB family transcription factor [Tepidiformaceae bacterium]|nr:metalloregulator ArsR/SmtB family transcription factor [Tepidiformaceae bacterium]
MSHRAFKDKLYPQFARIAQALASDRRLELIDLLAQAPRHVEALAEETSMSLANVSQHLQTLRQARLVETSREGTRVVYRLAGDDVLALWLALRGVAERRLAEVARLRAEFAIPGSEGPLVARESLREGVVLIDVRPRVEFENGHLPGALSVPIEELEAKLAELPHDRPIVTYCRGEYCQFADEAVALLRERGFEAVRLEGGWPEWLLEGRPVEAGLE